MRQFQLFSLHFEDKCDICVKTHWTLCI